MSKGTAVPCKLDTAAGSVKEILKKIVDEVLSKEGWSVNTKEELHNIYGKMVWGASVQVPADIARSKYGIEYGPMAGDKRVVPVGRELTQNEAAKIQNGDMSVVQSPEFKSRAPVIGMDVHSTSEVMQAKRDKLQEQIEEVGAGAVAVNNVMEGLKVLESGGKKIPAGFEQTLTNSVIEALKTGTGKIDLTVNFGGQAAAPAAGGLESLAPKKVGPSPVKKGPLGLMQ